jgi:hypothetical protein
MRRQRLEKPKRKKKKTKRARIPEAEPATQHAPVLAFNKQKSKVDKGAFYFRTPDGREWLVRASHKIGLEIFLNDGSQIAVVGEAANHVHLIGTRL